MKTSLSIHDYIINCNEYVPKWGRYDKSIYIKSNKTLRMNIFYCKHKTDTERGFSENLEQGEAIHFECLLSVTYLLQQTNSFQIPLAALPTGKQGFNCLRQWGEFLIESQYFIPWLAYEHDRIIKHNAYTITL